MKGIPLTFLKMELQKAKALHAKNALSTKQDLLGEWQFWNVINADQLPYPKATEVL